MSTRRHRVVVVGAGLGGLAAAARLAHQGYEVEVFEKGSGPGGRCGQLRVDGFQWDTGPTLLLMPEVLEQTFAALGRKVADYLTLVRCAPNYRLHFRDGSNLSFGTDLVDMQRELERIEPGSFAAYLRFLAKGKQQYQVSLEHFVGRNFDSAAELFTPANLARVLAIDAHRKMYPAVARQFADDRLRAALTFQTMYLGISPFESPAVYGLLPFTEHALGIWFPLGGMYAVPRALEKVALEEGATLHYRTPVARVEEAGGRASAVVLEDGRRVEADLVLVNADLPWAYRNLLQGTSARLPGVDRLRYTSSAFMLYLGVRRRCSELEHHNVIFGGDYAGSFDDLFEKRRVPEDPSFYVNAPAHTDPSLAPPGKDSLYVLVPVPNREAGLDWRVEGPRLRTKIFARLAELGLEGLERDVEVERRFTPDDYQATLNLERGAAFGLSHHFFQVGPFRPRNQDPRLRNLFFVGASTQPGTGVPMVMLSAKLVVERIERFAAGVEPRPRSSPLAPLAAA
jgi:phytoene desaturase